MNTFKALDVAYIRSSRTIETILISNGNNSKAFFVYNHEGNSFRVFEDHLDLIHFFQDKAESNYHFNTEIELDDFLSNVRVSV